MNNKIRTEAVSHLFEAILTLKTEEECFIFFEDLSGHRIGLELYLLPYTNEGEVALVGFEHTPHLAEVRDDQHRLSLVDIGTRSHIEARDGARGASRAEGRSELYLVEVELYNMTILSHLSSVRARPAALGERARGD